MFELGFIFRTFVCFKQGSFLHTMSYCEACPIINHVCVCPISNIWGRFSNRAEQQIQPLLLFRLLFLCLFFRLESEYYYKYQFAVKIIKKETILQFTCPLSSFGFYVRLGENVQLIFDQSLLSRREKLHEEDNSRETLLPTSKASATMYASVRGQQSQSSRGRQQMGLQRGVQSKIQQSRSIATDRSHSISSDVLGMQRFLSIISYLHF